MSVSAGKRCRTIRPSLGELWVGPRWAARTVLPGSGAAGARLIVIGTDPAITGEPPEERSAC